MAMAEQCPVCDVDLELKMPARETGPVSWSPSRFPEADERAAA
jgi:hypothetical protein